MFFWTSFIPWIKYLRLLNIKFYLNEDISSAKATCIIFNDVVQQLQVETSFIQYNFLKMACHSISDLSSIFLALRSLWEAQSSLIHNDLQVQIFRQGWKRQRGTDTYKYLHCGNSSKMYKSRSEEIRFQIIYINPTIWQLCCTKITWELGCFSNFKNGM